MKDLAPTVPRPAMPCFAFMCWDGPDAQRLRDRDLDGHLVHVEKHWRDYVIAGPMREPEGGPFVGSLLLVLAPTLEDAWAICRGDPYFTNGQFARIEVKHLTRSIGQAIGGKIWESADAIRHPAGGGNA